MIDIHAHILPGIDDGAEDMTDTLAMAKIAVDCGVTGMVATPHCNIPRMYDNYFDEFYVDVFRETERALEEEGIDITLYSGMEVFVTPRVPQLLSEGKLLTINGSRYMLVEFAFDEDPDYVQAMLRQIKSLGVHPIIAHPERYEFVQEDPQKVYQWRKRGYLVQINKGSLVGRFGRRSHYTAHQLLSHNLVTAIASDTHSPYQRTPYLLDAYEALLEDYSEKYLKVLFQENPMRICKDMPTIRFDIRSFEEDEW